jgi:hypothetical protein
MRDEDGGGNRTLQISTRLEPELVRAIEQRARQERPSTSNYIAAVLAEHVGHRSAAA